MASEIQTRDPFERAAEEFVDQLRRGERPPISEYVARYPELTDQIRELFPTLVEMEQVRPDGKKESLKSASANGPPKQLGDYQILREIGAGGMGVVYEAVQISLGRRVALKVLPPDPWLSGEQLERFRREARMAARLHHTHIVPVFGVGEDSGVHFYAMQFIHGQSLAAVLDDLRRLRRRSRDEHDRSMETPDSVSEVAVKLVSGQFAAKTDAPREIEGSPRPCAASQDATSASRPQGPQLPTESTSSVSLVSQSSWGEHGDPYFLAVANLGVQAAEALAHAHGEGMLHRDVKPSNLLVDIQGDIWLTDFGLAKATGAEDLTNKGDIVGTLRYMAPERFAGRTDGRGDVYGLGLTLYEMVTLRPAFQAAERPELVNLILHTDPPRPRSIDLQIPRDLETIVLKAIAKEPADRYQTPADMADDLRQFLFDRPIRARRTGPVERLWRWSRRNPVVAGLTSAVLVLMAIVGAGALVLRLVSTERDRAVFAKRTAQDARRRAVLAEREANTRRHLAEAARLRHSGQPGRKSRCLDQIRLAMEFDPSQELRLELRNELIAALALTDVRFGPAWHGAPEGTWSIAVDPDRVCYARSLESGEISVRRLADDCELFRVAAEGQPKQAVHFSRDGRVLLGHSNFDGGSVQLWDTRTGLAIMQHPLDGCLGFDFSHDARMLAIARSDATVSLIDLDAGAETRRLRTASAPIWVAFHPAGRRLAVCFRDRAAAVQILDVEQAERPAELPVAGVNYLAWHPDGNRLAVARQNGATEIWDVGARRRYSTISASVQPVTWAEFDSMGDLLLTSGWDGYARLWETQTSRQVAAVSNAWLAWSRDGRVLALRRADLASHAVEADRSAEFRMITSRLGPERGVMRTGSFSPDGRLFAMGTDDGIRFFDLSRGEEVGQIEADSTPGTFFVSAGDLVSLSGDGLDRWPIARNATGGLRVGPPQRFALPFVPMVGSVSSESERIAVSANGQASVLETNKLDLSPFSLISRWAIPLDHDSITISSDGRWAVSRGWHSPTTLVWDANTGELVKRLATGPQTGVAFTPDSRELIIGRSREYAFWEIGAWQVTRRIDRGDSPFPGPIAFSPDRSTVVVKTPGNVLSLVHAETHEPLARLESPVGEDRAAHVSFSPDGNLLVANDRLGISVWNLRLIRERLAEFGLDWKTPLSSDSPPDDKQPLVVEIVLGDDRLHASEEGTARRLIETYRVEYESNPESALACNNYAWHLATSPKPLRDVTRALTLAEKAVALDPGPYYRNTLGVAYYRLGRYREAIDVLTPNLLDDPDSHLPYELYFLAMSYHQLGDSARSREYFNSAARWHRLATDLDPRMQKELATFRAEAESLLRK